MDIKVLGVGLRHHNDALVFDVGMKVSVVFDEGNEHSDKAFKVLTEGGLVGAMVAESQYYWGSLATRKGAILSSELKELINNGYTIREAVVEEISGRHFKSTKIVVKITLDEPETAEEAVSDEMEELDVNMGQITVVGTRWHEGETYEGEIVTFKVVGGNTTLFNEEGVSIGVLPQSDKKVAELEAINAPITKNRSVKDDNVFLGQEYVVTGIVEDKYVFIRPAEAEDMVAGVPATEEPVVDHIGQFTVLEELISYDLMVKATNELCKLIVAEETTEEPVKNKEDIEMYGNPESELDKLGKEIKELKADIEAKQALVAEKMAKREELAKINRQRLLLIDGIRGKLEDLTLEQLEAMASVITDAPSLLKEEEEKREEESKKDIEIKATIQKEWKAEDLATIPRVTVPQKCYCHNCAECKYSTSSSKDKNLCFTYEFWEDIVSKGHRHFVDENNSVCSFTYGEGGFGNARFNIELEDGETFNDVGLWHRGTAPESVAKRLRSGKRC